MDFQHKLSTQKSITEMLSTQSLKKFLKWLRNGDELLHENGMNPKVLNLVKLGNYLDFQSKLHPDTIDIIN